MKRSHDAFVCEGCGEDFCKECSNGNDDPEYVYHTCDDCKAKQNNS